MPATSLCAYATATSTTRPSSSNCTSWLSFYSATPPSCDSYSAKCITARHPRSDRFPSFNVPLNRISRGLIAAVSSPLICSCASAVEPSTSTIGTTTAIHVRYILAFVRLTAVPFIRALIYDSHFFLLNRHVLHFSTAVHSFFYHMDGVTILEWVALPEVYDQSWKVVGTADFDNEGNEGILWRNVTAGDTHV